MKHNSGETPRKSPYTDGLRRAASHILDAFSLYSNPAPRTEMPAFLSYTCTFVSQELLSRSASYDASPFVVTRPGYTHARISAIAYRYMHWVPPEGYTADLWCVKQPFKAKADVKSNDDRPGLYIDNLGNMYAGTDAQVDPVVSLEGLYAILDETVSDRGLSLEAQAESVCNEYFQRLLERKRTE